MAILKRNTEEVVSLLLFGLSISIMYTDGIKVTQRSVFNGKTADLAVDDDVKSCALSGWETGGWWKGDLSQAEAVAGVTIIGDLDAFQLRVGNQSESVGMQRGFDANPLCAIVLRSNYMAPHTVTCRQVLVGSCISIQMVDPVSVSQMKLCDIKIIFA